MSDYIKRSDVERAMYHEAFETDTDLQKWDSGCWIRYKLFENVMKSIPSADVVERSKCKECQDLCKECAAEGVAERKEGE